jgi:hypothetical protein
MAGKGKLSSVEKATYSFHITDREKWALVAHSLMPAAAPKDHAEQERLSRMYEEFSLEDILDQVMSDTRGQLTLNDFSTAVTSDVEAARDTVDYALEMTNKTMLPMHSLNLRSLIRRLKLVQAGTYNRPEVGPSA